MPERPPIPRIGLRSRVSDLLRRYPVVTLVGARQVGKTTLARQILAAWRGGGAFFDLEHPRDAARLADATVALEPLRGLVVLDEVQVRPDLLPLLRALADRPRRPATFLLTGSASPSLWRGVSESLAGRVALHRVEGFGLDEVGARSLDRLWLRGGFPPSFLAGSEPDSLHWRTQFVETHLSTDLPALGVTLPAESLRRLWTMLAHLHGSPLNLHALGRSLDAAHTTVRRWLDILAGTFMVRLLSPWSADLPKRLVRAPKVYVADTGLLHALLDIPTLDRLAGHPVVGTSWESFAIDAVVRRLGARPEQCFFYGTHAGAELDLLVVRGGERLGFEVKRTAAPSVTRSMNVAMKDLGLDRLDVVHAGEETFPLAKRVRALALRRVLTDLPAD